MSRPPKPLVLSKSELDHLLTVMRDTSQDGSYYGNRLQYWRRHHRIWDRLIAEWERVKGAPYPLRSRDERHG